MRGASGAYLRAIGAAGVPIIGTPAADVLDGTDADDEINGRAGDDTLLGHAGNDSLDGWAGADRMEGGAGDDVYFVDNAGDRVVEAAGAAGGTDLVRVGIDWTLDDNLENLRLYGAAISGIGNALNNLITGNGRNNVLNGRGGNDTIYGNGGNDSLDGWAGGDTMDGGAGDDTYLVDNAGDVVIEALAGDEGGTDLVRSSVDLALGDNLENLRLHGKAGSGTGNDLGNAITGNGRGNDLRGFGGNDTIDGGGGDDTFHGWDDAAEVDWEWSLSDDGADVYRGGEGTDTYVVPMWSRSSWEGTDYITIGVRADLRSGLVHYTGSFASDQLESIENLITGDASDTIHGTDAANVINVGGGANVAYGRGGDDRIVSGSTFDYLGGEPDTFVLDRLDGGAGDDVIVSGGSYWEYYDARSDHRGMATDILFGRAGDDLLIGGSGNFTMNGGSGADTFDARADVSELREYWWGTVDVEVGQTVIKDFDPEEGDRIILRVGVSYEGDAGREKAEIPDFVGRSRRVDVDEVGYTEVAGDDGGTDTVLTYRYEYHTDYVWTEEGGGLTKTLDFKIVLEDYAGGSPPTGSRWHRDGARL